MKRAATDEEDCPVRLRRAEAVLEQRTGRIRIVLEQCLDSRNHQAVLRTAEALGVQYIYTILPADGSVKDHQTQKAKKDSLIATSKAKVKRKITKGCQNWLTIREFTSIKECIDCLRADKCEIWATDLSPKAIMLSPDNQPAQFPQRLAVVIGRESDGVSAEMLSAADKRVFIPMFGFTESFNLSVATALTVQQVMHWCPSARGDLTDAEKKSIRKVWFRHLAKSKSVEEVYDQWLEKSDDIKPLENLRRDNKQCWIPPKIRKREAGDKAIQQRANASASTEGESTHSSTSVER